VKTDLKEMQDRDLIAYFEKLIESGCNEDSRERRQAEHEILGRLGGKTRYITEKGTVIGQPVNLLYFSEDELEILEDLTAEDHFYERKVMAPLHQKVLSVLEVLRRSRIKKEILGYK
jgi:hypothetical protein